MTTAIYGNLTLVERDKGSANSLHKWMVTGRADMLARLKRMFGKPARAGAFYLDATPTNAEDLKWFCLRYPLKMDPESKDVLERTSAESIARRHGLADLRINGAAKMNALRTLIPLRDYQKSAVAVLESRDRLLVGDDLGLGKTAIALGAHAAGMGPTIIVCQTHLQEQWKNEAQKFLFGVEPHVVKQMKVYPLPGHDFLIIPYTKLRGWGDYLSEANYGLIVFDEAQELRRKGTPSSRSAKYESAKAVADATPRCLGLTATPIYNYGEEIFNVADAIESDVMGSYDEFTREWCTGWGSHYLVKDTVSLHGFLSEEVGFFLRRRRCDVGRELPPVVKVVETVDFDAAIFAEGDEERKQLASTVLSGEEFTERGKAARALDLEVRHSTGVSKAKFVADFVIDRVRSGEKVILGGWHREVYSIWQQAFGQADSRAGIRTRAVLYSGSETPKQKAEAARAFVEGEAEILILSLRSGAGLDGLQKVASLVVFGELDWSPQVHDQFIGRLNRDGQENGVTAVFLVADTGSDPVMASVLGLKREQSEGIVDGELWESEDSEKQQKTRGVKLAEGILEKK